MIQEMLNILDKLKVEVQEMREEGDGDLRTVLFFIEEAKKEVKDIKP